MARIYACGHQIRRIDILSMRLVDEARNSKNKVDATYRSSDFNFVSRGSSQIDIADTKQIMQYGSAAQQHIAAFSEQTLEDVKTKDLGDIGESLANLTATLRTTQNTEKKGLAKFFQDRKTDIEATMAQYAKAETNVDKIQKKLEEHQEILIRDIARYDQLYELSELPITKVTGFC